jgi:hypothetical protein
MFTQFSSQMQIENYAIQEKNLQIFLTVQVLSAASMSIKGLSQSKVVSEVLWFL